MKILDETLARLIELAPPPRDVTHRDLGDERSGLPADYLEVAEIYGPGAFCDFLWLLVPGVANDDLNLDEQRAIQLDVLRQSRAQGEVVPPELLDERSYVLPWAVSDNGDVVWWVRPEEAEQGKLYVCAVRPLEWAVFDATCAEFLLRFVSDELPEDVLLSGLGKPRFHSWKG